MSSGVSHPGRSKLFWIGGWSTLDDYVKIQRRSEKALNKFLTGEKLTIKAICKLEVSKVSLVRFGFTVFIYGEGQ